MITSAPKLSASAEPADEAETALAAELVSSISILENPDYQQTSPAFGNLTSRDWLAMTTFYAIVPMLLALAVYQ